MAEHNDFGKLGEDIATEYLKDKGYEILDRNWRFQKAEIDIIAREGETIVVVEVKARGENTYLAPEEAVDNKKINLLALA